MDLQGLRAGHHHRGSGGHRPSGAGRLCGGEPAPGHGNAACGRPARRRAGRHRDRLIAYLLLEGLRPGQIVRLDIRHLYETTTSLGGLGYDVRAPDDHENVGKQYQLEPLTSAAVKEYLPKRRKPADGVHCLIIGEGGQGIVSEYPNKIVQQIAATSPVLAERTPPVTADALAHTGFWDAPPAG